VLGPSKRLSRSVTSTLAEDVLPLSGGSGPGNLAIFSPRSWLFNNMVVNLFVMALASISLVFRKNLVLVSTLKRKGAIILWGDGVVFLIIS